MIDNQTILRVHYKIEAIPIIQSFVSESAKYFGANEAESQELKLATEEAALHIIKNYPQSDSGFFDIFCSLEENKIFRIVLSNTGPPIDEEHIPEYKVEDPEKTVEGLQFFLIKKLTDNFFFLNRGKNGWQTILEKRLSSPIHPEKKYIENKNKPAIIQKEKLKVCLAKPEDAYLITKLAYSTYRYSYTKTIFYYPEMLKEAISSGTIIPFVAKTKNGEIVIHTAFIRSAYSREIVESGAFMSMPEYRKRKEIFYIVSLQEKFCRDKSNNVEIVEANLVTAHTASQKFSKLYNFIYFALKLSVHDRSRFIGMNDIKKQRETLLYGLNFLKQFDKIELFPPKRHKEFINHLFSLAGQSIKINESTCSYNFVNETKFRINKNEEERFALIKIKEFSKEWQKILKKLLFELKSEGIITIHLTIPIFSPIPSDLEKKLNDIGFFFSGVLPLTPYKWMILFSYLEAQKFDFDKIKVADEKSKELKNYIENCYKEILDF